MANSISGKFYQNNEKYNDVKLITTADGFKKAISSTRYLRVQFAKNNAVVTSRNKKCKRSSNVLVACHLLKMSKVHMMQLYYHRLLPALSSKEENMRLIYMDTDSAIIFIPKMYKEVVGILKNELSDIFDFSNYPKDHALYSKKREGHFGVLKDEMAGKVITSVYTGSAKSYIISTAGGGRPFRKCKGVAKGEMMKYTKEDYKNSCLLGELREKANFYRLGTSSTNEMALIKVVKKCLGGYDTKRYIIDGGKDSYPFGSIFITKNKQV